MRKSLFAFCAFLMPLLGLNAGITGQYCVTGHDPYLDVDYCGVAMISKIDDVYKIHWDYSDNTTYTGVGVLKDDCIAFTYTLDCDQASGDGIILYNIKDCKLKGSWTVRCADPLVGTETLTRNEDCDAICCEEDPDSCSNSDSE